MVTPYARRRANSGNVNRHTRRAMTAMGVTCKQPASTTNVKKMEKMAWKVLYLSNSYGQKNRLEILPMLRMGVQGPLYQDNSDKMQQLQGTIILETYFIHIYILN
jgi:hypothetical protein